MHNWIARSPKGSGGKPKYQQNIAESKEFLEKTKQRFHRTYTQGNKLDKGGFGIVYDGVCTKQICV